MRIVHYIAVLAIAILLTLACEVGPTNTSSPPPTPINISVDELTRAYEGNAPLAKSRFDGNPVLVYGVQLSVEERTSGGYVLLIETGIFDSISTVRCETESLPVSSKGDGLGAWGIVSTNSGGQIVLEDCWYSYKNNVLSEVLSVSGNHPSRSELSDACFVLREAGFENVANDRDFTSAEAQRVANIMYANSMQYDEMVAIVAEVTVELEGANTKNWCDDWK